MIDVHAHVLPGIDDGAADVQQALEMLRESYRQGVTTCVATPHLRFTNGDSIEDFLRRRDMAYSMLMQAASGMQIPQIVTGAEVYMDGDISRIDGIGNLCIGDTDFMLVELPFMSYPGPRCCEWLFNLNLKGITPIIAHIDRYDYHKELIEGITGIEVVYQINNIRAHDMHGRRLIKKLLGTGYLVVMGSDMHNPDTRPCDMKKAYDVLTKKMPDHADDLFEKNAATLLGGDNLR